MGTASGTSSQHELTSARVCRHPPPTLWPYLGFVAATNGGLVEALKAAHPDDDHRAGPARRIDAAGSTRTGNLLRGIVGALLVAGCTVAPPALPTENSSPPPSPTPVVVESPRPLPTPAPKPGDPLVPPPRPGAAACRSLLMADTAAARRIRAALQVDGVAATEAAIAAAAADPSADIGALGIPLTAAEVAVLGSSGIGLDRASSLAFWVQAGEPGRFGGIWIDPPGGSHYVVAILTRDPAAALLARCLDAEVDIGYVAAMHSLTELNAVQERVTAQMEALRARGVMISSVGITVQESRMVVEIGVSGLTEATRADLVARFGQAVFVSEQPPITFP